jgi:hypothetical protein
MADQDWIRVYSSNKTHHIEIIKAILKENGIESFDVDKRDSEYITIGDIELYVDAKDVPLSQIIIEQQAL